MTAQSRNHESDHFDVVVCGGGPVGLSMTLLLGRAGLSVAMFERRPTTTTLPKGQYLHASTGELFRQWGVWDLLQDVGWETENANGQGFYVTVANGPVAAIRATEGTHDEYVRKWEAHSPVFPRKVPASDYEAAIRRRGESCANASLHFNARVTDVTQQEDHVHLTVEDAQSHATKEVTARYVVACDGAHSFIRSRLGRGQDHGPTFGNQVLVEFRADLDNTLGKDGFFHSFVLPPRYAGWFGSQHPESGLWRYSFRHDEETPPIHEVVLERIRGALGMPELAIEIFQTYRFDYSTGLLRKWREGNVLFAGDAAHWHSPWGGFGMNSGIQDANNLAWKLDLVLRGKAGDSLLETYEVERKSKARITVKSATYNSLHYQAIAEAARVGEGELFAQGQISEEAKLFLSQRSVPHGENAVLHTGYQLGTVYQSQAVIRNHETPPVPELAEYTETTVPGVRAPHAWLLDATGQRVSTIDLWGKQFVLIGHEMPSHWLKAAQHTSNVMGIPIPAVKIGKDGMYRPFDSKFEKLYGYEKGDVILVRPDGFIAAKLQAADSKSAGLQLLEVMQSILGMTAMLEAPAAVALT
ncbi:FAD-dependent monooxygenase [Ottowia thiooxydans]|uniref:2-polyprenyl-6-methoxyphenol hydroxylase-like FAD-dependent oxidoreductase n=1 Tax=Ottowia thiooxydans TaxID=219182 RepID=A0ABV2QCI8_9BURK